MPGSGMRPVRLFGLVPLCVVLLAAATAALVAFDPATTWWFPSCPFHALTGWLCPLCGSLRAIHALLTGSPLAALAFNPFTIVGLGGWVLTRERAIAFALSPRGLTLFAAFGL